MLALACPTTLKRLLRRLLELPCPTLLNPHLSQLDAIRAKYTDNALGGVNGQRPLPSSPFINFFPLQHQPLGTTRPGMANRGDSSSIHSTESLDIDMDESSIDLDTGSPSKKGQRVCTEFPPCKQSFTRSEHLARHIRYVLNSIREHEFRLKMAGNIPESGPSNVLNVRADSLVSTTCVSMRNWYMRRFPATLWLLLVLASSARFELIVSDHRVGGLALALQVAQGVMVEVTAEICQHPALLHLLWSERIVDEGHLYLEAVNSGTVSLTLEDYPYYLGQFNSSLLRATLRLSSVG